MVWLVWKKVILPFCMRAIRKKEEICPFFRRVPDSVKQACSGMDNAIILLPQKEGIAIFHAVMKRIFSYTIFCAGNIMWSVGKVLLPVRGSFLYFSFSVK